MKPKDDIAVPPAKSTDSVPQPPPSDPRHHRDPHQQVKVSFAAAAPTDPRRQQHQRTGAVASTPHREKVQKKEKQKSTKVTHEPLLSEARPTTEGIETEDEVEARIVHRQQAVVRLACSSTLTALHVERPPVKQAEQLQDLLFQTELIVTNPRGLDSVFAILKYHLLGVTAPVTLGEEPFETILLAVRVLSKITNAFAEKLLFLSPPTASSSSSIPAATSADLHRGNITGAGDIGTDDDESHALSSHQEISCKLSMEHIALSTLFSLGSEVLLSFGVHRCCVEAGVVHLFQALLNLYESVQQSNAQSIEREACDALLPLSSYVAQHLPTFARSVLGSRCVLRLLPQTHLGRNMKTKVMDNFLTLSLHPLGAEIVVALLNDITVIQSVIAVALLSPYSGEPIPKTESAEQHRAPGPILGFEALLLSPTGIPVCRKLLALADGVLLLSLVEMVKRNRNEMLLKLDPATGCREFVDECASGLPQLSSALVARDPTTNEDLTVSEGEFLPTQGSAQWFCNTQISLAKGVPFMCLSYESFGKCAKLESCEFVHLMRGIYDVRMKEKEKSIRVPRGQQITDNRGGCCWEHDSLVAGAETVFNRFKSGYRYILFLPPQQPHILTPPTPPSLVGTSSKDETRSTDSSGGSFGSAPPTPKMSSLRMREYVLRPSQLCYTAGLCLHLAAVTTSTTSSSASTVYIALKDLCEAHYHGTCDRPLHCSKIHVCRSVYQQLVVAVSSSEETTPTRKASTIMRSRAQAVREGEHPVDSVGPTVIRTYRKAALQNTSGLTASGSSNDSFTLGSPTPIQRSGSGDPTATVWTEETPTTRPFAVVREELQLCVPECHDPSQSSLSAHRQLPGSAAPEATVQLPPPLLMGAAGISNTPVGSIGVDDDGASEDGANSLRSLVTATSFSNPEYGTGSRAGDHDASYSEAYGFPSLSALRSPSQPQQQQQQAYSSELPTREKQPGPAQQRTPNGSFCSSIDRTEFSRRESPQAYGTAPALQMEHLSQQLSSPLYPALTGARPVAAASPCSSDSSGWQPGPRDPMLVRSTGSMSELQTQPQQRPPPVPPYQRNPYGTIGCLGDVEAGTATSFLPFGTRQELTASSVETGGRGVAVLHSAKPVHTPPQPQFQPPAGEKDRPLAVGTHERRAVPKPSYASHSTTCDAKVPVGGGSGNPAIQPPQTQAHTSPPIPRPSYLASNKPGWPSTIPVAVSPPAEAEPRPPVHQQSPGQGQSSHPSKTGRSEQQNPPPSHPPRKSKHRQSEQSVLLPECKYFKLGCCTKGDRCTFRHVHHSTGSPPIPPADSVDKKKKKKKTAV